MALSNSIRRILIKVDSTGASSISDAVKRLNQLNRTVSGMSGNLGFLTRAFKGWIGVLGVRQIARLNDEMLQYSNTLRIVTNDNKSVEEVMEAVRASADRTFQSVTGMASSYARMGSALRNAGATTDELIALTETLTNTFRVAGTNTTETVNTMIQLSQAFSSGEVRGQELRSVMEQNAVMAGYLRKEYAALGGVYKAAENGQVRASDITRLLIENFAELQSQAEKIKPTFEQTVNVAMNDLSMAVFKLNEEFNISVLVFNGMRTVVDNLGSILAGFATGAVTLLIFKFVALATATNGLTFSLRAMWAAMGPVGWAVLAGTVVTGLIVALGGVKNAIDEIVILWHKMNVTSLKGIRLFFDLFKGREAVLTIDRMIVGETRSIARLEEQLAERRRKSANEEADLAANQLKSLKSLYKAQRENELSLGSGQEGLWKTINKLRKAFEDGEVPLDKYIARMDVLTASLDLASRKNRNFLNQYLEDKRIIAIDDLNNRLRDGVIGWGEYNRALEAINISKLKTQLDLGKISMEKYNQEMLKFQKNVSDLDSSTFISGLQKTLGSIESLGQGVAGSIEKAFGHLEDYFMDFIKTGTTNFEKFAQAVLDDLNRIIIRAMVLRPLAEGILNFASPGVAPSGTVGGGGTVGQAPMMFKKGGVFSGRGVEPFARGGVVGSPTLFGHGRNKLGVMGEAGPEAILPVRRLGNGDLGVQAVTPPVVINITNSVAGAEVSQSESTGPSGERNIEIVVHSIVKDGLRSGKYDREMSSSFGASRKGI